MSITCSIPGCNGKNSFSEQTKLFRVPALAVGSDGMIFDLTKRRRKKWFEVLESSGLNEFTAAGYRVCSNHFVEGKPSPLFDNRSRDWAPTLNLHDVKQEPPMETNTSVKDEPGTARGRSKKRNTTDMGPPTNRKTYRSKSVGASRTYNNSKQVDKSLSGEKEDEDEEQPFVFVDIQKIKEGTPVSLTETISRPQTPNSKAKQPKYHARSFATQTNPNVLPPLNWGKKKYKKQPDPRFSSSAVQTDPINISKLGLLDSNSPQACLGEVIEFIRKQILDFNLKTATNSFKIKECSLNFEKEGEEPPIDKEANSVVVLANRLLSSNWPLLESVAMSLDLHRLKQKNDEASANYIQTLTGKTETIRQINTHLTPNKRRKTTLILPENVGPKIDLTRSPSLQEDSAVTSPILPKISNVVSLGDLMKDEEKIDGTPTPVKPKNAGRAKRKLVPVEVPSVSSVPSVSTLAPKSPLTSPKTSSMTTHKYPLLAPKSPIVAPKIPIVAPKIPILTPARRALIKTATPAGYQMKIVPSVVASKNPNKLDVKAREKLGTDKVVRVVAPKLPEYIYKSAMEGRTITLNTIKSKGALPGVQKFPAQVPSLLWMNRGTQLVDTHQTVSLTNEVTNTPLSFKSVKNIPLKLPQAKGVAGYLLVPATGSASGGATPIMYVPNVEGATPTALMGGAVVTNGGVSATPLTTVANASMFLANSQGKVAIPRLPPPSSSRETPTTGVGETPTTANKETNLKCPYCLKTCKDGLEFINHHKSILCRQYRTQSPTANDSVKCGKCRAIHRKNASHMCKIGGAGLDVGVAEGAAPVVATPPVVDRSVTCNVCGRIFSRPSGLASHVKCHPEYLDWIEKCVKCPLKFPTTDQLKAHFAEKHPPKDEETFRCDHCDKKFTTPKRLQCHKDNAHSVRKKQIKVRCKYCSQLVDLEGYKKSHWKECKSKSLKKNEEGIEERKKPTGFRSTKIQTTPEEHKKKKDDPIEEELSKLFAEGEGESSEYENEELLSEGYEKEEKKNEGKVVEEEKETAIKFVPLGKKTNNNNNKEENKVEETEIEIVPMAKRSDKEEDNNEEETEIKLVPLLKKKRFMNMEGSDSEEDSFMPSFKIQRVEKENTVEKSTTEEENEKSVEESSNAQKVDFKSLLGMIGGENDIDIEEMEEEEEEYK